MQMCLYWCFLLTVARLRLFLVGELTRENEHFLICIFVIKQEIFMMGCKQRAKCLVCLM